MILSIHELEIVHATTGERRKLRVAEVYDREITLQWPLYGTMRFHNRNGKAVLNKHWGWSIEKESLKALHRELKIHGAVFGPGEDEQMEIKK